MVYLLLRGFSKTCNSTNESDFERDYKCLITIIRDHYWHPNVRIEALVALSRILQDTPHRGLRLRKIVYQLRRQKIVDKNDELQNTLLYILYPDEITPKDVWNYLIDGRFKNHDTTACDQRFFRTIVDQSNENQIRELLDSLCKHTSRAIPKLQDFRLEDIVLHLLEKGLNLFGDKLSISELYRWFTLVEYDDYFHQLITAHSLGSTVGVNNRSSHAI